MERGGPPEVSVVCLIVGLLGGKDPVLISCTNLLRDRQGFFMGLARSGGPAAATSWFIQTTATQTWEASCLLISTAVLSFSPAQPQARATSSLSSETVLSTTASLNSSSHCGRLQWRPCLSSTSIHLTVCATASQNYIYMACEQDINHKGTFPPAYKNYKMCIIHIY